MGLLYEQKKKKKISFASNYSGNSMRINGKLIKNQINIENVDTLNLSVFIRFLEFYLFFLT